MPSLSEVKRTATMPTKLNEVNHAEDPARRLLEQLGWNYAPREDLSTERGNERDVLLKDRLRRALLRLNEWITDEQALGVHLESRAHRRRRYGAQPESPRVSDLRDAPDCGHAART